MAGRAAAEVVPLHDALEPLPLGHADDVDAVLRLEQGHQDLVPHRRIGASRDQAELLEPAGGRHVGSVEMALERLGHVARLAGLHEPELHRLVTLLRLVAPRDHDAGAGLDDRAGDRAPFRVEHLRHRDLPPDQPFDHARLTAVPSRTP